MNRPCSRRMSAQDARGWRNPRPLSLAAFTLIELLTTIAVVFALASLATHAVHRGRQRAQTARCANNLRQIGISAMMHFIDYDIPAEIRWAHTDTPARPAAAATGLPAYSLLPLACFPDMPPLPTRERGGDTKPPDSPDPSPPPAPSPAPTPVPRRPMPRTVIGAGEISAFGLLQKGCPGYGRNPVYALDQENEPPYRSYGILQYNLGRKLDDAYEWIFACSDYAEIVCPTELASARHSGGVNVFFSDGHSRFMAVEDVPFPDAE